MESTQPKRTKHLTLLLILAGSGLAFLSSTQTWFSLRLSAVAGHLTTVSVPGSAAAPALLALALAGLALAAAFAIGGRVIRVFLALVGVLLGALIVFSVVIVLGDPVAASSPTITAATGIAGDRSVRLLVTDTTEYFWPWCALVGGAVIVASSAWALVTVRRWPDASRKYQLQFVPADHTSASETLTSEEGQESPADPLSRDAAIGSWDDLTRGDDPTR